MFGSSITLNSKDYIWLLLSEGSVTLNDFWTWNGDGHFPEDESIFKGF